MSPHNQLNSIISDILSESQALPDNNKIIEDYKLLNERCDNIISKIKIRREQTQIKN